MVAGIVVHFHPGRPHDDGTVIDAIAASDRYRSQWETRTSNGGLTAVPGGARWRWESRLFDGRYDDADPTTRPVYGAFNRRDDSYGGSPRFGSAHLRLRPEVLDRATFCWPDSVFHPTAVGGPERLDELCRLADAGVHDPTLLPEEAAGLPLDDPLNDYVEAHVHGGLVIARDVEAVVVDPSDREAHAEALDRLGCRIEEHPGYRVTAESIDPTYRGPVPVELARSLGGEITPARLGEVWQTADPQAVKWLWHCLARFGRRGLGPSGSPGSSSAGGQRAAWRQARR
ncbi:DUF3626 domain-containing protein [Phycicoccus sonneratiae]|uniref:DUF3626 domain-containing protein n=1 Tax=Phycicoccus sonneratiae TaxID=2807628 RepID=A0ABS2CLL5_9MICO|nr:DUF3626 domain-containing protein [Phycicoccus sonneraticus]MBM6400046.1 DUF3626 domain-containing protein [Phycicoccus sonneraticus]